MILRRAINLAGTARIRLDGALWNVDSVEVHGGATDPTPSSVYVHISMPERSPLVLRLQPDDLVHVVPPVGEASGFVLT